MRGYAIDGVGHQFHLQLNADVNAGHGGVVAVEGVSSTLVNHVTELDVSIYADPGSCYSHARHSALPRGLRRQSAADGALAAGAAVSRAVQRLQSPERHLGEPLGHRRQSHLAQLLPGDPHQSAAAVRYGRQSEVGILGGGRSDDLDSIVETNPRETGERNEDHLARPVGDP